MLMLHLRTSAAPSALTCLWLSKLVYSEPALLFPSFSPFANALSERTFLQTYEQGPSNLTVYNEKEVIDFTRERLLDTSLTRLHTDSASI